jgi:hypothetical protein
MKLLGTDAVGVGERDLRFGLAYYRGQIKRTGLPVTSANLIDKKTGKPAFLPSLVKKVGTTKVGVFALLSQKANLGPARDSLQVLDPAVVAKKTVAELKGKGATVIVLLSQLGKVESEDLVASVEGISAVIAGRDVPILQKGRMIKNTVACYGGEQGQYLCKTVLALDAQRRPVTGEAETAMLGPEVGEKPDVAKLTKSFEDAFNERLRKTEAERLAKLQAEAKPATSPEHYLGDQVCIRCHPSQGEQWKTTAHSLAWQTLVDAKKDADPECIGCHVVGFRQAGGFQSAATTPQLANVQCENCHGMGTQHDAFGAGRPVSPATCMTCHNQARDPGFDFEKKVALIVHSNTSGESIEIMKKRKAAGSPMLQQSGMKGSH